MSWFYVTKTIQWNQLNHGMDNFDLFLLKQTTLIRNRQRTWNHPRNTARLFCLLPLLLNWQCLSGFDGGSCSTSDSIDYLDQDARAMFTSITPSVAKHCTVTFTMSFITFWNKCFYVISSFQFVQCCLHYCCIWGTSWWSDR